MRRTVGVEARRIVGLLAIVVSLAGCASSGVQQNMASIKRFHDFADRQGDIPSCKLPGKGVVMFPGMSGDTMLVRAGQPVYIVDEGDSLEGPTLENHDRLVLVSARPDQFQIERKGSTLLLCSTERNISAVIVRQFCGGVAADGLWNNSVEEVTFSSGETWLSDALYASYRAAGKYVTRELLDGYHLKGVSDREIENWRIEPMSKMTPRSGLADRACQGERERYLKSTGDQQSG